MSKKSFMDTETETPEELTIQNNGPPGCRGFPECEYESQIEDWLAESHYKEPEPWQDEIIQKWISARAKVVRDFREGLPETANLQYELAKAFGGPWGRRRSFDEPKIQGSRYGYNSLGQVNEREMEAIELMLSLKREGFSYKAIAVIASERGYTNRAGNSFSPEQVSRILKRSRNGE